MSLSAAELNCLTVLQAAATTDLGLIVKTNNPTRARAMLYVVRQKVGDTQLADIQIRVSPDDPEGEIWLIHTERANASIT
jgi:hypothetical protein